MAKKKQLALLRRGVSVWNDWVENNRRTVYPDLAEANLSGADLNNANLCGANLQRANLAGASLSNANLMNANLQAANLKDAYLADAFVNEANLSGANLEGASLWNANLGGSTFANASLRRANLSNAFLYCADFTFANLWRANLSGANLSDSNLSPAYLRDAYLAGANLSRANLREAILEGADLSETNLSYADLSEADLSEANLEKAVLVETILSDAIFKNCRIYGISAWDPHGIPAKQSGGLVVTPKGQPDVTVDDLEVAQLVYLLLRNEKVRNVIDTIGRKGVLILGRFTAERKAVLDAIREKLRRLDYVPMMFDFDKPTDKDFTETIMTLAGMCRFIIADITNPKSSPLELQATVPNYMVPFVPIIQEGEKPFSMFKDLYGKFDWVLKPLEYDTAENLVENLEKGVINRALKKHKELMLRKAEKLQTVKLQDL